MNIKTEVAHPEWLDNAVECLARSLRLYAEGQLPPSIHAFMLATPAKRLLRAIYGSDREAIRHWLADLEQEESDIKAFSAGSEN